MKKLSIAVDMDGILADFTNALLREYAKTHPDETLHEDQISSFHIDSHVKDGALAKQIYHTLGFFRSLPVYDGATEALAQLVGAGHEIIILTSPVTSWSAAEKMVWLSEHFDFLPGKLNLAGEYKIKNLVITSDKHLVPADILIDDYPINIESYDRAHPKAFKTTLAHAYNRDCKLYNFFPTGSRAEQWRQICAAITGYASSAS